MTSAKLTESAIETLAIERLQALGYQYLHGGVIAFDGDAPERTSYSDVILNGRLQEAVAKINPHIPATQRENAIKDVLRISSPDLLTNNEAFHRLLTEGVPVSTHKDGDERGDRVWLVDFANPLNNDFLVVNQFTIIENHYNKRPDLILFINGLPLVVIELKNAGDENATIRSAFKQLETYKSTIPSLFTPNAFTVISDGLEAKAGSISAGFSRFMAWKTADGKSEANPLISQLETLIVGMLNPTILLDLIRHFIVFEKARKEDPKTGQVSITTVKKLAAYHQYYAVNAAVASTLRAADLTGKSGSIASPGKQPAAETPESHSLPGVNEQPRGDRKAGVVWHTQGSGKSLSMVFYTGKIVLAMDNPTVLVITDRNDLDDQLFDTFASAKQLLRQDPVQAESRDQLKELLKVAAGGVVFSTIQKFQPEEGNVYEQLSDRKNIVVIADEAHRSQYGFRSRMVTYGGGGHLVTGFAQHMRDALPNASFIGFTGTPVEQEDRNTKAVFGDYISVYDIQRAVEDGATVPIYYESRLAQLSLRSEVREKIDEEFEEVTEGEEENRRDRLRSKWAALEAVVGEEKRVRLIADDLVQHFEARIEAMDGKAMVVCMSRRICVDLYDALTRLRPEWHDADDAKGRIKVVMTGSSSDPESYQPHRRTKTDQLALAKRFKDPADPLSIVIVRDMWLTGFDAPCLHTLYVDKPMRGHGLMQAIARVNRVFRDKPGGLVVDYLGLADELKNALATYTGSGGKGTTAIDQKQAVEVMLEKLEVCRDLFHGFDYSRFLTGTPAERLKLLPLAQEHVFGIEDGRDRLVQGVTELVKAFALAVPDKRALEIRDEVAFFQAVKAAVVKSSSAGSPRSDAELEGAIRQIVSKAISTDGVVDIFSAAGLKKPDLSILSDDFLADVKRIPQKNLALELLRKLLNDELRLRRKKNVVQSEAFSEKLEKTVARYRNRAVETAQVIEEMIRLAKEMREAQRRGDDLHLTEDEVAFYDALETSDSAVAVLGDTVLAQIARDLTQTIRNSVTIDWTVRENVRAQIRVRVRRLLARYGYPPDKRERAVETVIKQAELLAADWAG